MTKEELNQLEVVEQLKYINDLLIEGKSLRDISSSLGMSKTTFRDRFKKIGYIYNTNTKQYYKDNTIKVQQQITIKELQRTIKQATQSVDEFIQNDNNSISKSEITKQENNNPIGIQEYTELKTTLAEVKELLEMKDQLKEVIQYYNKSKNIINVSELQELKIDKDKFDGELKGRLIKVYSNVNNDWIKFCKSNNQFKMQDLYSIALLECIEKYKK